MPINFLFVCPVNQIIKRKTRSFAGSLDLNGIEVDWHQLFDTPKDFWSSELDNIEQYFKDQLTDDFPEGLKAEMDQFRQRLSVQN